MAGRSHSASAWARRSRCCRRWLGPPAPGRRRGRRRARSGRVDQRRRLRAVIDFDADLVHAPSRPGPGGRRGDRRPGQPGLPPLPVGGRVRRALRPALGGNRPGRRLVHQAWLPGHRPAGQNRSELGLRGTSAQLRQAFGVGSSIGPTRPASPTTSRSGRRRCRADLRPYVTALQRPRHVAGDAAAAPLRAGQRAPSGRPGQGLRDRRRSTPRAWTAAASRSRSSRSTRSTRSDIARLRPGDRDQRAARSRSIRLQWSAEEAGRRRGRGLARSRDDPGDRAEGPDLRLRGVPERQLERHHQPDRRGP